MQHTVCVTGASGYIAAHIIQKLLAAGCLVRGTVRKSPDAYPFLSNMPGAGTHLQLFTADLLTEGSFNKACRAAVP